MAFDWGVPLTMCSLNCKDVVLTNFVGIAVIDTDIEGLIDRLPQNSTACKNGAE